MNAIDRIRDEMAKSRDNKVTWLGEGMTALLGIHPEYAGNIAAEGKTLAGCMEAIRKRAEGGVADPITSTRAICEYYGIQADDMSRLCSEVHMAVLGGTSAPAKKKDDFDLDALLGGL